MKTKLLTIVMLAAPAAAAADQVLLKGGGVVSGEVVERRSDTIVLEVGPGRMTLPMSRVLRVVESGSALGTFRARAARLAEDDVAGWLALGVWARENDLGTQALRAFEHVLAVDPQSAAAHDALGHVRHGGRWVSREDAYRAQGLVFVEGEWLTPSARAAILAARATEAQGRQATLEAEARIREAEARAREAESAAREAEARRAEAAASYSGIPYPYVFGGPVIHGGIYGTGHGYPHPRRPNPRVTAPPPAPRPSPASDSAPPPPRPARSSSAIRPEGNR